jgi:tetratricopeptide (TPR) repeat protein
MLRTFLRCCKFVTILIALCLVVAAILFPVFQHPGRHSGPRPRNVALDARVATSVQWLHDGYDAVRKGNLSLAEHDFRRSIQIEDHNRFAWLALADLYCQHGRSVEALPCYRTALGSHPTWRTTQVSQWGGEPDPESVLRYAKLCDLIRERQEADHAYKAVVVSVEFRQALALQYRKFTPGSSPSKRAYTAIGVWRDHQGQRHQADLAYQAAGVDRIP